MASIKNRITIVMLAFCLLASAGCQLIYTEGQEPAKSAPLYFYIAVDNSLSYGLPKAGRRERSSQEVFDGAKSALYRQLISRDVFQEGDYLVGIAPFTDEVVGQIKNNLTGGPMAIRSSEIQSLSTLILDNFNKIELRPVLGRGDYKTYYRNVLDQARGDFQKLKAAPDQQVGIILTDERGSEFEGAAELQPEKYPFYHVIKLEAKAVGNGKLTTTPDDRLAEIVSQKDAPIADYLAVIRNQYRERNPISVEHLSWVRVVIALLILGMLGFFWPIFAKSQGRDWRWTKQAPSLSPTFNPDTRKIHLQAERFQLPDTKDKYWLNKGGTLKNTSPQDGWIELVEALEPGEYEITVQPDNGPSVKGAFKVTKEKIPLGLAAKYDAGKLMLFLTPHNFPLPTDKDRYSFSEVRAGRKVSEAVDIGNLNAADGKIVFARPLPAGHHLVRVILDDDEVTADFEAGPPPPPKPKYLISVARYRDIDNPRVVELTEQEINLLEQEDMKASIWVKRDDLYFQIRTTTNVQKDDGNPIVGSLRMDLGTVMGNPIRLELVEDREDIEISVQRI